MVTPRHVSLLLVAASLLLVAASLLLVAASLTASCASVNWKGSLVPLGLARVARQSAIAGDWDQVNALQPGSRLVVTTKTGDRIEGDLRALGPSTLDLTGPPGRDTRVSRSDVGRIVARGARDRLKNGLLMGAGVGLGAALAILAVVGSQDGYVLPSGKWGAPLLLTSAGAVVGTLIDRAYRRDEVVHLAR